MTIVNVYGIYYIARRKGREILKRTKKVVVIFITTLIAIFFCLEFLTSNKVLAQETTTTNNSHLSDMAAADAYFGHMKKSILGIRNELKDLNIRADYGYPNDGHYLFNKAIWVEDSFMDWAIKYPHDPWLYRYGLSLRDLFRKIDYDGASDKAIEMDSWLKNNFYFYSSDSKN